LISALSSCITPPVSCFYEIERKLPGGSPLKEFIRKHGCIFSILEACRTFSFRFCTGRPFVQSARRKCLHFYYYSMDRDFGLIHVRIQSWFPMQIQVYLNGHEWLARKLAANHVRFTRLGNVFLRIEDLARAQTFSDRFHSLDRPAILNKYARRVNPDG